MREIGGYIELDTYTGPMLHGDGIKLNCGRNALAYLIEAKEIKRYTKFAQAAQDLINNKIDCLVMDLFPAQDLVASNEELAILDGVLFEDKYAIAVQKGNQELLDQINTVIQELKDTGKIEEFTANHTNN